MKMGWLALATVFLFACASERAVTTSDCEQSKAFERGWRAAKEHSSPDLSFSILCPSELSARLESSYRDGFDSYIEKKDLEAKRKQLKRSAAARAHSLWICEVEGSEKIFTGVGVNVAEATSAARASCNSHLRASDCHKADCKKNM
jgi:hypothetical protein